MANIEIHGGHNFNGMGTLQLQLAKKFQEMGMGKEVVIDEIHSYPHYCDKDMPRRPILEFGATARRKLKKF